MLCRIFVCQLLFFGGTVSSAFADAVSLTESVADDRVFEVTGTVDITGTLETPVGKGKAQTLPLSAKGTLHFRERRLPGSGRDAEALRVLREYLPDSGSEIEVRKQIASLRLRPARRLIIAQGRRVGVDYFTPLGTLTYTELELLQFPGETLAAIGMLPLNPVEAGESWTPESWVVQMLTGTEAIIKSELSCTLVKIDKNQATVSFTGSVEGAIDGAEGTIVVNGEFVYHLNNSHISRFRQEQSETRSIGAVSPGIRITAKTSWTRTPASDVGHLTDEQADRVPLDRQPEWMLLSVESPWGIRFEYDRNWHLFHETDKAAVYRLVEDGVVVAQFNVTNIADAAAGEHTSEEIFQADIRESLEGRLKEITKAEQLKTDDGRFLYRVTAVGGQMTKNVAGEETTINITWYYYLCAAPTGQQVAFVFSVDSSLVEQLANRDLGIVQSLEFTKAKSPAVVK